MLFSTVKYNYPTSIITINLHCLHFYFRVRPAGSNKPQRHSNGDEYCDSNNHRPQQQLSSSSSGNSNQFLTLEFCSAERAHCQSSTLVLCASKNGGGASGGRKPKAMMITSGGGGGSRRTTIPNSLSNGQLQQQQQQTKEALVDVVKGGKGNSTLPGGVGGDTMYTNAANLEQTISLQQELFRQSMMQQQQRRKEQQRGGAGGGGVKETDCSSNNNNINRKKRERINSKEKGVVVEGGGGGGGGVVLNGQEGDDPNQKMEWKVKRRPDGSRYIVRRPVQGREKGLVNGINSNRGTREQQQLNQQNHNNELTTEDETMSEIKMGRYWSREERKRHVEKAKERRLRQEQVLENVRQMQRKNQVNGVGEVVVVGVEKEGSGGGGGGVEDNNKIGGLLSVTTV